MKQSHEIIIGSPLNYEELVAYIRINKEVVALVQKEEGVDNMKIEFFDEKIKTEIYLDNFLEALQEAKKELLVPSPYLGDQNSSNESNENNK